MDEIIRVRQGRCSEYSAVLYQMILSLGWRARLIVDWTDHVWVEALLPARGRQKHKGAPSMLDSTVTARASRRSRVAIHKWIHLDPCEGAVDEPKLYHDWGKNHTYIIAVENGKVTDVTAKYTSDWNAALGRRELSQEKVRQILHRFRKKCHPQIV